MVLKLYNTLTRTKDEFHPLDPKNVRMYVCGPTVYDFAHIGNARPVIVFDVLFRLLRHLAKQGVWDGGKGETKVTYVRNITDVDDKINARAAEIATEQKIPIEQARAELTERTTKQFHEDVAALGALPPTYEPRATEHISHMIAMITQLIASGHAYSAEGHVLYDVSSKSDYGKLSRRSLDEMIAGARIEVAPYKKNPMDFVLWKPSKPGEPSWPSPWSNGRPGWHVECSAMSEALLGETFDIHGGGIDLAFPHHENEIAQSEAAHHGHSFAQVWMHNGFLQVEGEKMSKSLGNFVTIRELREGWKGHAWPGEALYFNMLTAHYRQPLDWTLDGLDLSHKILWDWYGDLENVEAGRVPDAIIELLSDDLNTPAMITEMHALKRMGRLDALLASLRLLGLSGSRRNIGRIAKAAGHAAGRGTAEAHGYAIVASEVEALIAARNEARKAKNFKESDRIRDELAAKGIVLKDGPTGTTWEVKR